MLPQWHLKAVFCGLFRIKLSIKFSIIELRIKINKKDI
jgi:hypothetical protein